jgi:16S rRNA (cytosine1407-C5)-methyltransferase
MCDTDENMEKSMRGADDFDAFYRGLYGDRWENLRAALLDINNALGVRFSAEGEIEFLEDPPEGVYRMDRASVEAARLLHLPAEGIILDACAAPGGKTLVLAGCSGPMVRIEANELSSERRRRLRDVLNGQLPEATRSRVSVTGYDAARICRVRRDWYDAILLDAPCSSERHVLSAPRALSEWTRARTRQLALRQWSLLSSCFLMLKPGGCLVYSTCSISPMENDGVLQRLEEKYGGRCDILDVEKGERTAFGAIVLPDVAQGAGPLYMAHIHKKN